MTFPPRFRRPKTGVLPAAPRPVFHGPDERQNKIHQPQIPRSLSLFPQGLKEMIRTLIKLPADEIEPMLKNWLWKASHSRIPAIYKVQQKIRRHVSAILSTARHKLSNARIEATNNKIKLSIRIAYGFRNIGNMIDMIMLRCSDIPIFLPGRQ